jgi:tetratricopeptide (TPR) repeat protein
MVSRTLCVMLAAGLSSACLVAQTGSSLVDPTKPMPPALGGPANPESLTPERRGDILMARKMYREAVETYQPEAGQNPVIWNKIGIAYHQMQQLDTAKKYYERAIKLNPRYAEALNNLGTVFYAKKSYRKAGSYYNKALKITPESASVYSNLGTALFARKKYKEASEAYQTALKLDPEVFEHRSSYGVLLQERSVQERAKFHYYLAKTYAKAGRNDLALQYIRKALEEGFQERKKLQEDPEFEALREMPEFKELLALEPRVL